jgi:hypothetical protein
MKFGGKKSEPGNLMITYPTIRVEAKLKRNNAWVFIILKCMINEDNTMYYKDGIKSCFCLSIDQELDLRIQYPKKYRGSLEDFVAHPDFNIVSLAYHMGHWKK